MSTFYQVRFRSNQTSKIIELLNKTRLRTKRDYGVSGIAWKTRIYWAPSSRSSRVWVNGSSSCSSPDSWLLLYARHYPVGRRLHNDQRRDSSPAERNVKTLARHWPRCRIVARSVNRHAIVYIHQATRDTPSMDRSLRATGLFGELTEQWTRKRNGSGSTRFKLSVKASCADWDLVLNSLNTATANRQRKFRGTRPSSMSDDRLSIAAL